MNGNLAIQTGKIENLSDDAINSIGGGITSDAMYGAGIALVLGGAATGQPEIVAAGVVAGGIAVFLDMYNNRSK